MDVDHLQCHALLQLHPDTAYSLGNHSTSAIKETLNVDQATVQQAKLASYIILVFTKPRHFIDEPAFSYQAI